MILGSVVTFDCLRLPASYYGMLLWPNTLHCWPFMESAWILMNLQSVT